MLWRQGVALCEALPDPVPSRQGQMVAFHHQSGPEDPGLSVTEEDWLPKGSGDGRLSRQGFDEIEGDGCYLVPLIFPRGQELLCR